MPSRCSSLRPIRRSSMCFHPIHRRKIPTQDVVRVLRRRLPMAGFDYDVAIVGSGFGGSVAAFRAAEKGYRVAVMEAGRRWKDEDIPKTQWNLPHFLWLPAAELYGIKGSSTSMTCLFCLAQAW